MGLFNRAFTLGAVAAMTVQSAQAVAVWGQCGVGRATYISAKILLSMIFVVGGQLDRKYRVRCW